MNAPTRLPGDQQVANLTPMKAFQNMPTAPRGLRDGRFRAYEDDTVNTWDESAFVKLNGSQLWALVTATSTVVLPEPSSVRNYVGFRNASVTANIYIEFGGNASPSSWLYLIPGTMVLLDARMPQDYVAAYSDAASGLLVVVNSTTPARRT